MERLLHTLASRRFPLTSERAAQDAIATALAEDGLDLERERSLGGFGVIDFYGRGIGVEVKVSGVNSTREIHRQLRRYARSPEIEALVLATGRSVSVPDVGKPLRIIPLARAWL